MLGDPFVRIDRTHKVWLVASLAIFGVALLVYAAYRVPFASGSMGGTAAGLAFGSIGFAFMIFAALLGIVVLSGVFGAVLQHYMPLVMTREVTMETIYEEIGHVRAQLQEEAEELIKQATGGEKKE